MSLIELSWTANNGTIFLYSQDVGNIDDQCRGPSIKKKGHLAEQLTSGCRSVACRATVNQGPRSFQRKIDSCAILRSLYAAGK